MNQTRGSRSVGPVTAVGSVAGVVASATVAVVMSVGSFVWVVSEGSEAAGGAVRAVVGIGLTSVGSRTRSPCGGRPARDEVR